MISAVVILAGRGWTAAGDRLDQSATGGSLSTGTPTPPFDVTVSPPARQLVLLCKTLRPDHPYLEKMSPAGFRFSQECRPSKVPPEPPPQSPSSPSGPPVKPGKRQCDGCGVQCVASSLRNLCKLIPKSQCRLKKFTCAAGLSEGQ